MYWSVDRHHFMQSEDRLDFALQPARNTEGLEQWSRHLNGWNALSGFGANIENLDERDERIEAAPGLLLRQRVDDVVVGEPDAAAAADAGTAQLRNTFVEVKAGSFVIIHHDLFHRGSRRRSEEAPWRPSAHHSPCSVLP